jgi:hypothetical protein
MVQKSLPRELLAPLLTAEALLELANKIGQFEPNKTWEQARERERRRRNFAAASYPDRTGKAGRRGR